MRARPFGPCVVCAPNARARADVVESPFHGAAVLRAPTDASALAHMDQVRAALRLQLALLPR